MDTRFWGPSAWRLLHTSTFLYEPSKKASYKKFFESIPYVLPCKYCRSSLTEYYEQYPLDDSVLKDKDTLSRWLYKIHNCVNRKLRSQHIRTVTDPTYAQVKADYAAQELSSMLLFWDFLFSTAYNHPKEASRTSKPIHACPPEAFTCTDTDVRNRWNTLPMEERIPWFIQFWDTLPDILAPSLSALWKDAEKDSRRDLSCRKSIVAWLWRQRCAMDPDFKDPYTTICNRISSYSSECNSASYRSKTCRRKTRKRTG